MYFVLGQINCVHLDENTLTFLVMFQIMTILYIDKCRSTPIAIVLELDNFRYKRNYDYDYD